MHLLILVDYKITKVATHQIFQIFDLKPETEVDSALKETKSQFRECQKKNQLFSSFFLPTDLLFVLKLCVFFI